MTMFNSQLTKSLATTQLAVELTWAALSPLGTMLLTKALRSQQLVST